MLADTADWKSAATVIAEGRVDTATIVSQGVRVGTWVSSTRPQVAGSRLIVDAAAIEVAAPSSIKWSLLYITITITIPSSILSCCPKTTSNALFY